jgi:hypothetical protein
LGGLASFQSGQAAVFSMYAAYEVLSLPVELDVAFGLKNDLPLT